MWNLNPRGFAAGQPVKDNIRMTKGRLASFSVGLILVAGSLRAQAPAAGPVFDVASIRPSVPITPEMVQAGKIHVGMKIDGARVDIGNFTLLQLIIRAYDVKSYQVQGLPWMIPTAQRYDIVANLPDGATKEQVPQMLQALLADRFKLVVRKETKDQKVYALVVAKGGPKMKETPAPTPAPDAPAANPGVTGSSSVTISQSKGGSSEVSTGTGLRQKMTPSADGKSMHFEISKATMALFAEGMTPLVDRPIVDMTELKGDYEVAFDISMQDLMNVARNAGANVPAPDPAAAEASDPQGSIFTAMATLGLKLEPRKSPLLMVVVEKAEKTPTEN
jgi:uncharacterized protein (TIGR03435 family)